jgi:outer membrane protein OmpA-like peptidoglycan-associated protein
MRQIATLTFLAVTVAATGCASTQTGEGDDERDKTVGGAVVGAIIGGVLANNTGNRSTGRTVLGAAAGAAVGGAIGHSVDEKERRLKAIAQERDAKEMEVERLRDDLLRVSLSSEASFDFDRATLKPEFKPTLDKVSRVLSGDPNVTIRVVGHTDSVGSEAYNQTLSERRAQATADYLISRDVAYDQVTTEGRGELEPRASNSSEAGRAQNRRVEIYLQAH